MDYLHWISGLYTIGYHYLMQWLMQRGFNQSFKQRNIVEMGIRWEYNDDLVGLVTQMDITNTGYNIKYHSGLQLLYS